MAFRVKLMPRAAEDIETIYRRVIAQAPIAGQRWYNALIEVPFFRSSLFLREVKSWRVYPRPAKSCEGYFTAAGLIPTGFTSTSLATRHAFSTSATASAESLRNHRSEILNLCVIDSAHPGRAPNFHR
jgi:hypothetical protein